jgi:hypothetical protein
MRPRLILLTKYPAQHYMQNLSYLRGEHFTHKDRDYKTTLYILVAKIAEQHCVYLLQDYKGWYKAEEYLQQRNE